MNARLLTGAALAAALMGVAHWYPLSESYKPPTVTRRIVAYIYGVAGILLGLWVATDKATAGKALAVSSAAGAATVAAYGVDAWLHGKHS
jgi:hypothetical protein